MMNSAGDCFGQCRLCSCEYMGPATGKVSCLCGHPPYNHVSCNFPTMIVHCKVCSLQRHSNQITFFPVVVGIVW